MNCSRATRAARVLYDLAFPLALPLLRRNERLARGWDERTLASPPPRADIWVQAASAGEAWLAEELLSRPIVGAASVFTATNTDQGRDILDKAAARQEERRIEYPDVSRILPGYTPFDRPSLALQALRAVAPRMLVLLETELWPGLLLAARTENVPVVLVNGRMRTRSLARYLAARRIFADLAPTEVLAISEADASRFSLLFPSTRVSVMPNIKFDRVADAPQIPRDRNPLAPFVPPDAPFVALGSVREEEEDAVEAILTTLLTARPDAIVGLFPRHMERVSVWSERLARLGLPHSPRSSASGPLAPGSVLLGDVFGELAAAYALAQAAFVGGSLAPLGGQNFLEPLAAGVTPVIGPSWTNFAWVGREILDHGLVTQAANAADVAMALASGLASGAPRDDVRRRGMNYVKSRQGGAERARARIADYLSKA